MFHCLPLNSKLSVIMFCTQRLFRFSVRDQDSMRFILRFCSSVLSNTLAFQRELTLKKQNEALLQVAGNLFSKLGESDG